jgi:hypothetical protein
VTAHARRLTAVQLWAVAGVVFLFVEAAWRLSLRGVATMRAGLTPAEWLALAVVTLAFVYGEGVRALQRKWVPYVLARTRSLRAVRARRHRAAAPLFVMGLMGPPANERRRAWAGIAAIIAAVLIVSSLPEPWRGIIDVGVAAALLWGAGAMVVGAVRLARTGGED